MLLNRQLTCHLTTQFTHNELHVWIRITKCTILIPQNYIQRAKLAKLIFLVVNNTNNVLVRLSAPRSLTKDVNL